MRKYWMWFKFLLESPSTALKVIIPMIKSRNKPSEWIVFPEFTEDGHGIKRMPLNQGSATLETALRRAQWENFELVMCVYGKDFGVIVKNPSWKPL